MDNMAQAKENKDRLQPYLSSAAAWALAVGTSVGWGSLVVTSNTYLAQAGPLGSILGLLVGMLLMLIMCRNFFYMASKYPRAGGVYDYTKEVFGYDRAFLAFWFLSLTYIAMFWANATSLPLFARFFIGDTFRVGHLFAVFGYDVYLGEALLTQLPIDVLKLDMSFVRSAFAEKQDMRMIELIIGIADYLNVPVVAEGVETEEQYLALKKLGCAYVQGYYFSRPVPTEAFDRFLAERSENR